MKGRIIRVKVAHLALLSVATLVFSIAAAISAADVSAATICPQPDPHGCMVRCLAHKRRCFNACRVRKRQCIEKIRVEAKSCVLDCRAAGVDQDPGACKRDCIASAKERAKSECLADRPVCMKQCNPQGCRRRCAATDAPVDRPVGLPGVNRPVSDPLTHAPMSPAVTAATDPALTCEPRVNNECLDVCAEELRSCAQRVAEDIRSCVSGCRELHGEERRMCMADCAALARESGKLCIDGFHECVAGCRDTLPLPDPTTAP